MPSEPLESGCWARIARPQSVSLLGLDVTEAATVTLTLDGAALWPVPAESSGGALKATIVTGEGEHVLALKATDDAGNVTNKQWDIVVDYKAPEVTAEGAGVASLDAAVPAETEVAEAPAEPVAQPQAEPTPTSPLTEYTCEDCVYVATCPNRDQRLPKDCGSFQWR